MTTTSLFREHVSYFDVDDHQLAIRFSLVLSS